LRTLKVISTHICENVEQICHELIEQCVFEKEFNVAISYVHWQDEETLNKVIGMLEKRDKIGADEMIKRLVFAQESYDQSCEILYDLAENEMTHWLFMKVVRVV